MLLCRAKSFQPSSPCVRGRLDVGRGAVLTVVADGFQLKLIDPYNRPTLYVRRPGSDSEEVHTFHDDDAFFSEMATFIDTASKGSADLPVLSSFADGECL